MTAEDAFVDKIDLSIGYWALLGDEDAICSAMEYLRQRTLILTPYGEVLQVFQGEQIEHVYDIRHLRFTANPRTDNLDRAHTLVSGAVEFATWGNRQTSRLEDERARLNFRTQLNQTRFVQAQHLQRVSHPERPPPPSTIGAFELMHAIYKQAQNQYVAETIVASLVSFRRITPYNNDPLRETIHRLRDNGVLRTIRPKSRNYVVTDRYYHALERLRTLR
ncbi:MAG: hypothetical protein AAFV74_15530 [Pseudomonadota bacterium]